MAPPPAPCEWYCYIAWNYESTGGMPYHGERDHDAWHIVENARAQGLQAFQYENELAAYQAHPSVPMASPDTDYAYRRVLGAARDAELGPSELQGVEEALDGRAAPAPVRMDTDSHVPSEGELRALYEMEERVYGHQLTQAEYRAQRERRHRRSLVGEPHHNHDDDDVTDDHGEPALHDGDTGDVACVCEPHHPAALEPSPPAPPGCHVPTTNVPAHLEVMPAGVAKCPHLDPHITVDECTAFLNSLPNTQGGLWTPEPRDRIKYYHGCSFKLPHPTQPFTYTHAVHNLYGGTRDDLSVDADGDPGYLLVCRKQVACPETVCTNTCDDPGHDDWVGSNPHTYDEDQLSEDHQVNSDGVCRDGGPGSWLTQRGQPFCAYGTDCADCGPRPVLASPPPAPPPP